MVFRFVPRQRAMFRALGEALFGYLRGPTEGQLAALVVDMERHLGAVSRTQRTLLLLALELVRWLPVLLLTSTHPFEELSIDRRNVILRRMDHAKSPLLLMPLIAFKTLMSLHFYESERELRAMGYPGDERKRWLTTSR
jgi:hypothetical protein